MMAIVGLNSMTVLSTMTIVPVMWEQWNRPTFENAGLLSVLFIAGTFGNIAGGYLSDTFGPKPIIIGSALLSSTWMVLFLKTQNIFAAFVLIALLGASLNSSGPVTMVISHRLFPKNKGMASGLVMGIGGTLGSLGVGLIGYIGDLYTPVTGLYVASLVVLFIIPLVFTLNTGEEKAI